MHWEREREREMAAALCTRARAAAPHTHTTHSRPRARCKIRVGGCVLFTALASSISMLALSLCLLSAGAARVRAWVGSTGGCCARGRCGVRGDAQLLLSVSLWIDLSAAGAIPLSCGGVPLCRSS